MSVGKRILRLRLDANKTQREISEETGLAVSYLSRLENGRITPTIPTLTKISKALGVNVTAFFGQEPALESGDRCPVSTSGRCVLDQLLVGRGRKPDTKWEGYTPQQLELLRLCDYLIHSGDKEIMSSLSTMLEALLSFSGSKERIEKRHSLRSRRGPRRRPEVEAEAAS
ncbi:MAG: helix-turn-helix transcriptional regulator [Acidobacteriota bacterium]|jgi:DNA-binding XRE family transcriptional regulator